MSIKKYSSGSWVTVPYRKYETATDTITSLPKTIIGDGQPISAYTIKGNMTQSGTPTPSNPVYPTECGDKTANLYTDIIYSANLNTNGIPSSMSGFNLYVAPVEEGKTYRHNGNVCAFFATKPTIGTPSFDGARSFSNQFTISTGVKWVAVRYADTATDAMIVQGTSMPSSYIPMGYKIPISFGQGTYTNYLAEPIRKINTAVDTMASTGTATHNITKYEFTGNESITKVNSTATNYLYYIVFTSTAIGGAMCSHLQYLSSGVSDNVGFSQNQTYPNTFYFNLGADIMNAQTSGNTTEGFKEWLTAQYAAGTPLTLWRILETPTTESFTVPSIPTSGTAQSFDVDTTLKPSEVSLTYHGWHEHEDTKFTT